VLPGTSISQKQSRLGLESAKVWIRQDATITYTRSIQLPVQLHELAAVTATPIPARESHIEECWRAYSSSLTLFRKKSCHTPLKFIGNSSTLAFMWARGRIQQCANSGEARRTVCSLAGEAQEELATQKEE
jgi:hypothetical protein